jgi:hypothetical protein
MAALSSDELRAVDSSLLGGDSNLADPFGYQQTFAGRKHARLADGFKIDCPTESSVIDAPMRSAMWRAGCRA